MHILCILNLFLSDSTDRTRTQRKNSAIAILRLTLATSWRAQRPLDLRLVDSIYSQPRDRTAYHQRPNGVSRQRINIKAETTKH